MQAVFQLVDIRRRTITGHDNVFLLIEQFIEGIEDFHLSGIPGTEELHIIDEEEIQVPVLGPEFRHRMILDGIDEFIGECFTGYEENRKVWLIFMYIITDGMEKMGLSQSGGSINKERIHLLVRLVRMGGGLGYGVSGLVSDFIAVAVDKGFKCIFLVHRIRLECLLRFSFWHVFEEGCFVELFIVPDIRKGYFVGGFRGQIGEIRRRHFLGKWIRSRWCCF